MYCDYHVHSCFSYDSNAAPLKLIARAHALGLDELCFTEHMDYDETPKCCAPVDMQRYFDALEPYRAHPAYAHLTIRLGVETALKGRACKEQVEAAISEYALDFIIGSVHNTDYGDPYEVDYFTGKTREVAYREYIESIAVRMCDAQDFQVLGHVDYVAKNAPYPERAMTYAVAPGAFDCIFRALIESGRMLEYNTSAQKDRSVPLWGLDYLRRYVELGGEALTFGSDAHTDALLGWRIEEAMALAKRANVHYVATFERRKPVFHKL